MMKYVGGGGCPHDLLTKKKYGPQDLEKIKENYQFCSFNSLNSEMIMYFTKNTPMNNEGDREPQ